jgi:serine protease inhibitor
MIESASLTPENLTGWLGNLATRNVQVSLPKFRTESDFSRSGKPSGAGRRRRFRWQDPFVTSRTQPAPFTLPTGATTQANFMNQTAHFGYTELAVEIDSAGQDKAGPGV